MSRKISVFGIESNTVGQNVMRIVEGCEQPIGIPDYNLDQMKKIMIEALTPAEYDIVSRGFGIDCQRQKQNAIAKQIGKTNKQISEISWNAIRKLQTSPYKVQLEKLVPTIKETWRLVKQLKTASASQEELSKVKLRLGSTQRKFLEAQESCKCLEKTNASISYDNEVLRKKLNDSEVKIKDLQVKMMDLIRQSDDEKASVTRVIKAFCEATNNLERDFHASTEATMKTLTGLVANVGVTMCSIDELNLSNEVITRLKRVGLHDTRKLTKTSFRELTKMVGKQFAYEIEGKLHEKGLFLKVS